MKFSCFYFSLKKKKNKNNNSNNNNNNNKGIKHVLIKHNWLKRSKSCLFRVQNHTRIRVSSLNSKENRWRDATNINIYEAPNPTNLRNIWQFVYENSLKEKIGLACLSLVIFTLWFVL